MPKGHQETARTPEGTFGYHQIILKIERVKRVHLEKYEKPLDKFDADKRCGSSNGATERKTANMMTVIIILIIIMITNHDNHHHNYDHNHAADDDNDRCGSKQVHWSSPQREERI